MHIVGVGFDSPQDNTEWAAEEGFQFELWTDDDKTLAVYYGAASSTSALIPSRVTRVLDADGVLVLEYQVTDIGIHPQDVLDDCRILFGGD